MRTTWGPTALAWPHRIVTVDTLAIYELLEYLLRTEQIKWPNGHEHLQVEDTWRAIAAPVWTSAVAVLRLGGRQVTVVSRQTEEAAWPNPRVFYRSVHRGICTHDEVRTILAAALAIGDIAEAVVARLKATTRALIVDEVFDANHLDLHVVELAMHAGVEVTIIGDPWQALYGFRGATQRRSQDSLIAAEWIDFHYQRPSVGKQRNSETSR